MIGSRHIGQSGPLRLLASVLFVLPLGIAGCSSSSTATATAPALTIAPVITAFSGFTPSINLGQSTQLTWSVYGATSVVLTSFDGTNTVTISTSPVSPTTVTPVVNTTYTLTATNAVGSTVYTTTVNVFAITSFTATPNPVTAGGGLVLNWVVTGTPTSYSLKTTIGTQSTTTAEPATTTSVALSNVTSTATYTLIATTATGTYSASVYVPVVPAIKTFTATPSTITAGQPVTLAWTVTGGSTYQISGVSGTFTASPIVVYPSATGTYTLTATGTGSSSTATAGVTVTSATALNSAGTVTTASPGSFAVPSTFMGLSIGSTSYEQILGEPSTGVNKIYRQLLTNLTNPFAFNGAPATAQGPVILRIGGNSAETQGTVTALDVTALAQLATDTGGGKPQFILGVSLQPDVVSTAVAQAQAFDTGMPAGSILGIEIGNEPDLYYQNGYRTSSTYTTSPTGGYITDFANFQSALAAAGAGKVVGPAFSGTGSLSILPNFLTSQAANLSVVTQHAYGGNICPTGSGITLAADYLLQETAQNNEASASTSTVVNEVHTAGLSYRLGETNTINCSGQLGVSNTFQAALWSLDWMSRLAAAGVDGVNFFGNNNNNYSVFEFNTSTAGNGAVTFSISSGSVRPQYLGLVMFQQATQNAAKFLPVSVTTTANLKTYSWIDAADNVRVLVINKDESATGVFSVTVPGYGTARLTRLTAPAYTSTTGVVYNGQSIDSSTDGTLQGAAYGEQVVPVSGVYSFAMPITSAALLEIPHN